MRILSVLSLPLFAGCAALREAGTTVANAGGVLLDGAGSLTGLSDAANVAIETGDTSGLLSALTVMGIPPYVTGPLGLLLAIPRSRSHVLSGLKSLLAAIGMRHSSEASAKAADK